MCGSAARTAMYLQFPFRPMGVLYGTDAGSCRIYMTVSTNSVTRRHTGLTGIHKRLVRRDSISDMIQML